MNENGDGPYRGFGYLSLVSEHISENLDGSYRGFGYLSLVSDHFDLTTWSQRVLV